MVSWVSWLLAFVFPTLVLAFSRRFARSGLFLGPIASGLGGLIIMVSLFVPSFGGLPPGEAFDLASYYFVFGFLMFLFGIVSFRNAIPRRPPRYVTFVGERTRSKAEAMIAGYFRRNNIRYEYEKTARTRFLGRRIAKPDFYLTDYDVYVEYWGMVDFEDSRIRRRYRKMMYWKRKQYDKNRIRYISLYPSDLQSMDQSFRFKFKQVTGNELPRV